MSWLDTLFGGGYAVVQTNGVPLPSRGILNFIGATVTDDEENERTTVTFTGGSSEGATLLALPPPDLVFHEIAGASVPGFQGLVLLDEEFTVPSLTRFTVASEGTPNTPTISGGQITFVNGSGQNTLMSEQPALTVPQFAVKMRIASASSTAGNAYENTGVGVVQDSNNFIFACWRRTESHASIQVKIGGTNNFRGTVSVSWTPPFDLGLSLVANSLVLWQRPNGGQWTVITSWALTEIDFRTATLSGWLPGFSLATDNAQTYTTSFQAFQAGAFGGVSIRDICVFTNPDGSPVMTGNAVRLSATLADPEGAAYCGILTFDLIARQLTHVGALFVNRTISGTPYVINDNAAHCMAVGDGTYRLSMTTWGTPSPASAVQILHKHETVADLRTGIHVVSGMGQLSLPNIPGGGGCYDPFLVLNGSSYYLAYTVGPNSANSNYPALAESADLASWTGIGADTSAVLYEGTRIIPLAGSTWVCAGSSLDSRVYDLTMTFIGYVSTLVEGSSRAAYPPHPMFVPLGNYVYHVTFDNSEVASVNGTQGQFRLFRAVRNGVANQ